MPSEESLALVVPHTPSNHKYRDEQALIRSKEIPMPEVSAVDTSIQAQPRSLAVQDVENWEDPPAR